MNTAITVIPKLIVTVDGKVKKSNLPEFQEAAKKYVSQINRTFDSDEAFGQAEADIKALKAAEQLVKTETENIISQTHDINEVLKTLAFIGEEFRKPRLEIEKEVKEQKDSIRIKLTKEATDEVMAHEHKYVDQINNDGFSLELRYDKPDFYSAIKGLRTIDSVKDSIKKEKDAAIFSMTTVANDILAKLAWFKAQNYMEHKDLFGDMAKIIYSEVEGFKAMVELRISNHIAEEKKKEDQQRERIRLEEEVKAKAKAETEANAKVAAEVKKQLEEKARILAEEGAKARAEFKASVKPEEEIVEGPEMTVTEVIQRHKNVAKSDVDNSAEAAQFWRGLSSYPPIVGNSAEAAIVGNSAEAAQLKQARSVCEDFLVRFMIMDEVDAIRKAIVEFLNKTDWVDAIKENE